ncbi:ABC transporter permease [Gloeobacter violaceus]|uniref:Oligopeptide ABC transporter permease protein n=1 Tax=Gloeobacter violaceus (strain ATCC 29082 / PCC 7421) TaxID=251221 RepID=Q7NDV7_GLOVI|nr:ABC transporter permease subunit [Gloeobacter violaceus]BAC92066.1 oligopeptide ABC transporter permease protein [Gloeobacter violaceus PCC 7421]
MLNFILRRLLFAIPVLLVVVTISFFLVRLAPGGPFMEERAYPPAVIEKLNAKYGLDKPLHEQYFNYMQRVVLHFDLGPSTRYLDRTVGDVIAQGLPNSMILGGTAYLTALVLGMGAGIVAALRQNSGVDYGAMAAAVLGVSVPNFVLGPLLVIVLSLTLYWLPPARWGDLSHLILPALTLSALYTAYIARLTRSGLVEVLRSDYIRTARAKGLRESVVLLRHALRGSILPVVSYSGPALAFLLGGTIVVEKLFLIPGLGNFFIEAANARDSFIVVGVTLVVATLLIVLNLVVDIVYALIDPRIAYK